MLENEKAINLDEKPASKVGVILINTGSPDAPRAKEVRAYLKEFLSDPRVVDINPILKFMLLNLVILPTRPKKSALAYSQVWTNKGSPLVQISKSFKQSLQDQLGENFKVSLAMRYGSLKISKAIEDLSECSSLVILPMYPQYASSSWSSAVEETFKQIYKNWKIPPVKVLPPFYDKVFYLKTSSDLVQEELKKEDWDHVLFSFHGLPERHIKKSGCTCPLKEIGCTNKTNINFCYRGQSYFTARKIAELSNIENKKYSVSFQSRLGRTPWIKPYTDKYLQSLYKKGVRKLLVTCPSFVVDCLETLEEINIRARQDWLALGGESFGFVPSLNNTPLWVKEIKKMIELQAL